MIPDAKTILVKFEDIDFGDRRREEYADIEELAAHIHEKGLFHNLVCDRGTNGKPYHLLAGGRRYCALELLGWTELEIKFYDEVLSDGERRIIELHENIYRKDLTWQEEDALRAEIHSLSIEQYGEKVSTAKDAPGWTVAKTAELMKEDPATISRSLKLARASMIMPEIAQAKTRNDALKLLQKREEAVKIAGVVARIDSEIATSTVDVERKKLADSYMVKDFFEGVKDIPDSSINFIEIDPPYGIDLHLNKDTSVEIMSGYNEVAASEYPLFLDNLIRESVRVAMDNSWIVMWHGYQWTGTILALMRKYGLSPTEPIAIWYKGIGAEFEHTAQTLTPHMRLAACYEGFIYARKGNAKIQKAGRSNVYQYSAVSPQKKIHPTERPLALIEDILTTFACPGHNVLVPFLGSGKTLLAANNKKMKAFGYDLSREYKDKYSLKVYEGEPGRYTE